MSNLMKGNKSMGHVATSFSKPRVAPRRGTPLPDEIRRDAEELFGEDFSDVRVIVSDAAPKMGAIAFTTGSEIHIAPGVYRPGTESTRALLGHELAHVVQQRRGRATNPHGYGVAVVRDPGLEAEADRMGRALQMMDIKMSNINQSLTSKVNPYAGSGQNVGKGSIPHKEGEIADEKRVEREVEYDKLTQNFQDGGGYGVDQNNKVEITKLYWQAGRPKCIDHIIQYDPTYLNEVMPAGWRPVDMRFLHEPKKAMQGDQVHMTALLVRGAEEELKTTTWMKNMLQQRLLKPLDDKGIIGMKGVTEVVGTEVAKQIANAIYEELKGVPILGKIVELAGTAGTLLPMLYRYLQDEGDPVNHWRATREALYRGAKHLEKFHTLPQPSDSVTDKVKANYAEILLRSRSLVWALVQKDGVPWDEVMLDITKGVVSSDKKGYALKQQGDERKEVMAIWRLSSGTSALSYAAYNVLVALADGAREAHEKASKKSWVRQKLGQS